jgi:hypothetical protein
MEETLVTRKGGHRRGYVPLRDIGEDEAADAIPKRSPLTQHAADRVSMSEVVSEQLPDLQVRHSMEKEGKIDKIAKIWFFFGKFRK